MNRALEVEQMGYILLNPHVISASHNHAEQSCRAPGLNDDRHAVQIPPPVAFSKRTLQGNATVSPKVLCSTQGRQTGRAAEMRGPVDRDQVGGPVNLQDPTW